MGIADDLVNFWHWYIKHKTADAKNLIMKKFRGGWGEIWKAYINPSTAGAVNLHFLLAHYISVLKPVKDKKWH